MICLCTIATPLIAQQAEVSQLRVQILSTMLTGSVGVGEWGFAALVETPESRILFDTGARPETVLRNAREFNIDLSGITTVILSHNHRDHTGGLVTLRRELSKANSAALSRAYVGAGIFDSLSSSDGKERNFALQAKPEYEALGGEFVTVSNLTGIAPGVWLTGPVPRRYPERNWSGSLKRKTAAGVIDDTVQEDMSLVVNTARGLAVITGCGHAGIINTIAYAREKIKNGPVYAVIGGMHLFQLPEEKLDWTGDQMRQFGVRQLVAAHCTGIEAMMRLRNRLGLTRADAPVAGVGTTFDLNKGIDPGPITQ